MGIYNELGQKATYRLLDTQEHKQKLIEKIIEEAKELNSVAEKDLIEEIADVEQAIDDLKKIYGIQEEKLEIIKSKKNEKRGSFEKGVYIETLELQEADKWNDYYRSEPDRFKELK